MSELQPILDLLGGKFHRLPQVLAWLFAIQTAFKFINACLQKYLTARMVEAAMNDDEDDDYFWRQLLARRWYRTANFLLDLVLRLKLPTQADYQKAVQQHQRNTES